jgi:hypothetical protein
VRFDLKGTAALAYRWCQYNRAILKEAARLPERFFRLRYEDFVEEPEAELGRLCKFLDVGFDRSMLNFHERPGGPKRDWHRRLSGPLDTSLLYRWKTEMAPRDVATSEAICGRLGEELGYAGSGAVERGLSIQDRIGIAIAALNTAAERGIFFLPLALRSSLITGYRWATGSLSSRPESGQPEQVEPENR